MATPLKIIDVPVKIIMKYFLIVIGGLLGLVLVGVALYYLFFYRTYENKKEGSA